MKKIPLLCFGAALFGLATAPPVNAIPTRSSDALESATEVNASCLGWFASSTGSESFDWDGGARNSMAHWNRSERSGFRSLRLLALDRFWHHANRGDSDHGAAGVPDVVTTTVATTADVETKGSSVPDGGTTFALLFGSVFGLVIARRRIVGVHGVTR